MAKHPPDAGTRRGATDLGGIALGLGVLGAALLVDPGADASFDAPKRLAALLAIALAAAVALFSPGSVRLREIWAARLLLFFVLAACLSAAVSPRAASLDALRGLVLLFLVIPLGASVVLEGRGGTLLLAAFLASCGVNAVFVTLEGLGLPSPFDVVNAVGRGGTGGFLGNEGQLAQVLSLCLILLLHLGLQTQRLLSWWTALGLLVTSGLVATGNVTALLSLMVGASLLLFLRFRRGRLLLVALGLLAALALLAPPLRARLRSMSEDARQGQWDRVLTFRAGPWAAAVEMTRERPWLGFGPGTFEAEFVPHRLLAEVRARRRFVNPTLSSSYGEAHSEPLQAAAELGIPAAGAAASAFVLLLVGLAGLSRSGGAERREAALLASLLAAGGVSALVWFPLRSPASALPLLLVAGRGLRLLGTRAEAPPVPRKLRPLVLVFLGLLVLPEFPRYGAERRLASATAALREVLEGGASFPGKESILEAVAATGASVPEALPGDSRGWIVAGSARFAQGDPKVARELFGRALRVGERAEIDLNLGRIENVLGNRERATAELLRAGWVSPPILAALPEAISHALAAEISRLESKLGEGTLGEPPPLPPEPT